MWRRIRGDVAVGLGGMVVMTGVAEMTAEAGMLTVSRSMLGLEGSSEGTNVQYSPSKSGAAVIKLDKR